MDKALEVHPDERPYAWAEVDLAAIRHNASLLASMARPAALCAVVKGWGYGHGITRAAAAAVEGGASWLGVALVNEAVDVRRRTQRARADPGRTTGRASSADVARLDGVRPTLYRAEAVRAAAKAVRDAGRTSPLPVHLKVDTGMHRVGAAPAEALQLARTHRRQRGARARRSVDASRRRGGSGARRLHRASTRVVRRRASPIWRGPASSRRSCTPPTRADCSPIRRRTTTSSAAASRSMASRRGRGCPRPMDCGPP